MYIHALRPLFRFNTIEYGALRPQCAEGAPLPLRDAGAEIQGKGKPDTVCPTVNGPKQEYEESKPTHQHTGKGPCKPMDKNPSERSEKGKRHTD